MDYELGKGGISSPEDPRHWTLASVGAPTAYPDEAVIDGVERLQVRNQGKIGSCVGNTFEEIVRLIYMKKTGIEEELSWRFVYALCKCLDGIASEGTFPTLAASIVRKYGVPLAKYCPNDITLPHEEFVYGRYIGRIPTAAFEDALNRRAGADLTTTLDEDGIKQAICYARDNNGGVAILRHIGDTYWKDKAGNNSWNKADLLPMRVPASIVSGHEELLYKYDKEPGTGRTRIYWLNHWSDAWADQGRAWEYLDEWLPLVKELRVSVAAIPLPQDGFHYTFDVPLTKGMKGADVVALQHILKIEGCYPKTLPFTGYFWDKTFAGVVQLQEKYASDILVPLGLKKGTGSVGIMTLKWLNRKYSLMSAR